MRFDRLTALKSGFLALALSAGGALMATSAAASEGYGYQEHGRYMSDMGERVSRADKEFTNENEAGNVDQELEETWQAVVVEWNELEEATEENWEAAKSEMDRAWEDFQKQWNESFSTTEE